jgi:hypothetical protein
MRVLNFVFIISLIASCNPPVSKNGIKGPKVGVNQSIEFRDKKHSDSLSQFLRSNTLAYWQWVKAEQILFTDFSQQGLILGDAHIGNIYPLMQPECDSNAKLEWKNIDFDDGGLGPYFFDWVHFLISVKVIDPEIDSNRLFDAYWAGLNGEEPKIPPSLKMYMQYTTSDLQNMRKQFVDSRTQNNIFKYGTDDMEAFTQGPLDREQIRLKINSYWNFPVLIKDFARIEKKRGGSKNLFRLHLLINIDSQDHIFELKQIQESSLNFIHTQNSHRVRYQQLVEHFGYCEKSLQLFDFDGQLYLFKEKKTPFYEVPYVIQNPSQKQFLMDLADWGAYQLGRWHAHQELSISYIEEIVKKKSYFLSQTDKYEKDFIDLLKKQLFD